MNKELLIRALVSGLVWGFCYLYIRRFLNPENNGDIDRYKMDAFYGSLASAASVILADVVLPIARTILLGK